MGKRAVLFVGALLLVSAGGVLADSIYVGTLARNDVKVLAYRNGVIEFTIQGRSVDPVPADRVSRLELDDEPVFTKADRAFAEGDYAAAADGYAASLKSSTKPWLSAWILPRLLRSADAAGKLDLATGAFIQLAESDLKTAMELRPTIREAPDQAQLASAVSQLKRASGGNVGSPARRQAILSMLLDVTRAQGDLAGASAVADELLKAAPSDLADPAVARLVADIHLNIARLAIDQKDYAKALNQIESNRQLFADPRQQAVALYDIAMLRDLISKDESPDALKDRALDYMRAVAVARQTPDKANVPQSLFRVAQIQEKLGDRKTASALYGEVAAEYKGTPVAANAAKEQQRLKEKTGM